MGYLFSIGFSDLFQVIAKISKELDIVDSLRIFAINLRYIRSLKTWLSMPLAPFWGHAVILITDPKPFWVIKINKNFNFVFTPQIQSDDYLANISQQFPDVSPCCNSRQSPQISANSSYLQGLLLPSKRIYIPQISVIDIFTPPFQTTSMAIIFLAMVWTVFSAQITSGLLR